MIHNASFDLGMLNEELDRLGYEPLENEIVDTLELAKEKRPTLQAHAGCAVQCVRHRQFEKNEARRPPRR